MNTYIKTLLTQKLNEHQSFADKYGKHKYINISPSDLSDYKEVFYNLIKTAYADKGGNFEITSPNDLTTSDLNFWLANDMDADPDADIAIGGKKTPHGTKVTVMGQDGTREAKKDIINKVIDLMHTKGFYIEMDIDLANKFNLKPIADEERIRQVLNKDISYNGDGTYDRLLGGHMYTKVLVGEPK